MHKEVSQYYLLEMLYIYIIQIIYVLFQRCNWVINTSVAQMVKNLPAMQETQVRPLGLENFPGLGNGNPLQYSCLENPMDKGAWQAMQSVGLQRVGHN